MDKLVIRGGHPLFGEVAIAGAKNAALPILCAALLTSEKIILRNLPDLQDVRTMLKLLGQMGVLIHFPNPADRSVLEIQAQTIDKPEATYDMVKTMRASILVLALCWRVLEKLVSPFRVAVLLEHGQLIST